MSNSPDEIWFEPPDGAANPIKAAQQAMRAPLPKRFYEQASVEERDGSFTLVLDGRPARTPAGNPLAAPTRPLGEALAAEWQAQRAEIDPRAMPLTRIANSAIDGVATQREAVLDNLVEYAGSDLVCYRAGDPERLAEAQGAAWDPVLDWAHETLGARFVLSEGVMHVEQPASACEAVRARVERAASPFALAALHVMTTLTGSVLIALAHVDGRLSADEAWSAAHVDEHFQEAVWGEDEEAMARRATREADFRAASTVYRLSQA
jgi:chaperone required for assembly of F1-ATPase